MASLARPARSFRLLPSLVAVHNRGNCPREQVHRACKLAALPAFRPSPVARSFATSTGFNGSVSSHIRFQRKSEGHAKTEQDWSPFGERCRHGQHHRNPQCHAKQRVAEHASKGHTDSTESKGWTWAEGNGGGARMFGGGNGKARPWAFSTNRMNQAMCRGPKKSRRQARFAQARIGCSIDHSMGKTGLLYFLTMRSGCHPRGLPDCSPGKHSRRHPSPKHTVSFAESPSSNNWTWDHGSQQSMHHRPDSRLFAAGTGILDFLTGGPARRAASHKRLVEEPLRQATQPPVTPFVSASLPTPLPPSFAARPSIFAAPNRFIFPAAPKPVPGGRQIRSCSTSVPHAPLLCREAGLPILVPILGVLKSSAVLNIAMVASRIALTVLPLSVRGKILYAVRERYLKDPENASAWMKRLATSGGAIIKNGRLGRFNTFLLPLLVLAPIILTASIVIASIERTPVTGRLRVMMLSPVEEADLTASILSCGESAPAPTRDWVSILRSVLDLGDEGFSPTTGRRILLGGEVLDARDWRVRWTEAVLRRLESGVPTLATSAGVQGGEEQLREALLQPPPSRWPLAPRTTTTAAHNLGWKGDSLLMGKHLDGSTGAPLHGQLACEYDLLVIDRPDLNAFSFGFAPDEIDSGVDSQGRRGVVVVYTGFINDILGTNAPMTPPLTPPDSPRVAPTMFGSFLGRQPAAPPAPSPVYLEPTVLPTREQTQSLAVLLSHELAHLVLSHTLESYASTSLLIPHLSKLGSDVLRTLIYPITALLGPFVNDSIGASLNTGSAYGFGAVGKVFSSCSSRMLETEADLVALRLLSYSGIDPRYALNFWEERLASSTHSRSDVPSPSSSHLRLHSASHALKSDEQACSFLASHPVDAERVQKIRDELVKWVSFSGSDFAV